MWKFVERNITSSLLRLITLNSALALMVGIVPLTYLRKMAMLLFACCFSFRPRGYNFRLQRVFEYGVLTGENVSDCRQVEFESSMYDER